MSMNPQALNAINNTEKNTFNIVPTFSQTGQTIAENIAPTFNQPSGGPYFGTSNTSFFNFKSTATTLISSAYGEYVKPTFTPSSSAGTLTLTNAYGIYTASTIVPTLNGVVTNAYSLAVDTPVGATNNYTAYLGSTSSALVGIGTATPYQTLSVVGGRSYSITNVTTASYTVLNTDSTLEVNFAGAVTLTLPAATASNRGQLFTVKDAFGAAQANPITIVTLGGLIDGSTSAVISVNYGLLAVISDGTNYYLSKSKLGNVIVSVTTVTTPTYTALSSNNIIEVNRAGPVAVTLPAASASNNGQFFLIKDASGAAQTNPITISTLGGTIDGATSQVIGVNYGFLEVYSDGSNYYITDLKLAPAQGVSWINVTGTSQALSTNTGYYTTNSATTILTLPLTAPAGSIISVTGAGSGLWTIAQNAGQQIRAGSATTTPGTTGSLASSSEGDTVELLCTVANMNFQVLEAIGNLIVS